MIIRYKFQDGIISEVEVDDELGNEISEMDERDRKINRKETRRHQSLSDICLDSRVIAYDHNILDALIETEEKQEVHRRLMSAIETLQPQQKELLKRVYWRGEKRKDIAISYGVSERTIGRYLQKILDILYNLLK